MSSSRGTRLDGWKEYDVHVVTQQGATCGEYGITWDGLKIVIRLIRGHVWRVTPSMAKDRGVGLWAMGMRSV